MDQSEKPCVACAEAIKKDAVLCRFCNTRQDDQTFKKQKFPRWLVPAVGSVAVIGLISSAIAFAPSPEVQTQEIVEIETETLENGVQSPVRSENSDHDYLLDDLRIPRLETCEEWDEFWVYEGPAVSFAIANLYDEPMLAVSTQIYKKNIHLDADNDGVLCFFENEAKPLAPIQDQTTNANVDVSAAELDESWKDAVLSVREAISVEQAESHPLDFAVSPSVVPSHATIVREGVEAALRFWAPYIESDIPLAMTVVHPKDKQWFMKRWEQLGRDNTGEFWWDKAIEFGGGAVGTTRTGIPNMYFMTSEAYVPPRGRIDYYVHEVTHFFQSLVLGTKGEAAAPCWYFEGTANFIGFAMTYPGGEATTMREVAKERSQRAKVLMNFYQNNGGLTSQRLERDVLNFPPGDDTCQHEEPAFGYNLGMFVSEKLLIDFGFEGFVKMSKEMARLPLPEAFARATGVNYDKWVREDLFPYLLKTLPAEAR